MKFYVYGYNCVFESVEYAYTATSVFYEKNGNFDLLYKIETLEQIDTQFVRIDYVHEGNVCSKFGKNPSTGDFWERGEL